MSVRYYYKSEDAAPYTGGTVIIRRENSDPDLQWINMEIPREPLHPKRYENFSGARQKPDLPYLPSNNLARLTNKLDRREYTVSVALLCNKGNQKTLPLAKKVADAFADAYRMHFDPTRDWYPAEPTEDELAKMREAEENQAKLILVPRMPQLEKCDDEPLNSSKDTAVIDGLDRSDSIGPQNNDVDSELTRGYEYKMTDCVPEPEEDCEANNDDRFALIRQEEQDKEEQMAEIRRLQELKAVVDMKMRRASTLRRLRRLEKERSERLKKGDCDLGAPEE